MKILRFSLKSLLDVVSKVFDENFSGFVFEVEANLSRIKYSKKYLHLELVQFDEDGKLLAKAKWIIFDQNIIEKFKATVKWWDFKTLKKYYFIFRGRISFHSEYGFTIIIEDFDYKITEDIDLILEKLKKEGLLEKNKILPMPYPPFKIAIISSSTSEGLKDFLTILNNSGYLFEFYFYESAIHWNKAKEEVLQSLRNVYKDILKWRKIDFIVILRWGGWSHWILWQNDYQIAKAICYMPSPVIVAIGHTSDRFVLDEVAKISAKTPSEAAYFLIDLVRNFEKQLDDFVEYINDEIKFRLKEYDKHLDLLKVKIEDLVSYKIDYYANKLDNLYEFINSFDLKKLLNKWFAILVDENRKVLSKTYIKNLKEGDIINILVFNGKIIKAKIIDII